MGTLSTFDKIRELLLEGNIERALQSLSDTEVVRANPAYRNEVLLHASKWRNINDRRRQELVDSAALSQEENRLRLAILELIDLVEGQSLQRYGNNEIDVFISYRREDGSQVARLICAELKRRRKKPFLDVENLGSGSWDESLLDSIARAKCFVVILSPGALERISDEEDVLRREISHALNLNKKVVPIIMPEFRFPSRQQLPISLEQLPLQNGINYSHEFFDSVIDKLLAYLD